MSSAPTAVPLYLNDGHDPVFGIFHAPAQGAEHDTAVLICPPFGWDETCSYRSRRDWARRLADEGFPCLRIDLPGTGDSGGSPHDQQRLATWVDALGSAVAELRSMGGCTRVAAIGIGLGGLLICDAISHGAAIEDVVLWAAPARGRTLLRELRTFASLEDSELVPPPEEVLTPSVTAEGEVWVGGFVLTPETAEALEALDVSKLAFPDGLPHRALLLGRDGIAVDKRLRERMEASGASVTLSAGEGYGEMMARPHDAVSPVAVFAEVSQWLKADTSSAEPPATPGPPREQAGTTVEAPAAPLEPAHQTHAARTSSSIELEFDGARIRETPITIAQPFGELFGVLAEPLGQRAGDTCAVLLNAGAIRRIGPNRMWVETARRWSALGVPTVRLDLEGIGDADGDSGAFGEMAGLYVPELVDQVRGALDRLAALGYGPRFVLAGLCSGAFWAFHAALTDERVVAAYLLNPRALFWDPTLDVTREVRKAFLRSSAWRRVLRGEIPMERMAGLAYRTPGVFARRAVARVARGAARQTRGGDRLDLAFDRLRDEGKRIELMFSSGEPLYEELESEGRLDRLDRWPNIGLELVAGNIHTLRSAHAQASAHQALDRALDVELRHALDDALSGAS
ncbi:MAG TPA: alpha/beta fold hydrolase [Solirubrobacteraceae bacterium]|nr:alpha/beta fold hydrolase [Solirubrobacteraceae bacterium]